ncbi:hypothetical protein [Arenibaculum pallidiluteum]|nr:hypothetical protein [Arenibaculum pallidiluteum]
MASHAADTTFYYTGLAVFVIAVLAVFYVMRRAFDEAEQGGH